MCGIYGFTGRSDLGLVKRMAKASRKRGPDRQSTYVGKNISLAHNHLFIQQADPQKVVCHPFQTKRNNILLWNGEIYGALGSDTEWLGHMLDDYGASSLVSQVGMWALAFYKKQEQELHLVRDHFGTKPLFYTIVKGELVFASTLNSLAVYPGVSFEPDEDMIDVGTVFGRFVPGPRTEFKHIYKIAPGEHKVWSIRERRFTHSSSMLFMPHGGVIEQEYDPEYIKSLFTHCFREGAYSPQKTGLFYSGGLDSTAIMFGLAGLKNMNLTGFTSYSDPYEIENRVLTRAVADMCNIPLEEAVLNEDTYKQYNESRSSVRFKDIYGFDIQDRRRTYPRVVMNAMAAQHGCKVVLNGDGADELFVIRDHHHTRKTNPLEFIRNYPSLVYSRGRNMKAAAVKAGEYMMSWLPVDLFCDDVSTNMRVVDLIGLGEMYNTLSDSIAGYFSMESRPLYFHQSLAFRVMFMAPSLKPTYVIPQWQKIWPHSMPKHILTKAFEKDFILHKRLFNKKVGWAVDIPHRLKTESYKKNQNKMYDTRYKNQVFDLFRRHNDS